MNREETVRDINNRLAAKDKGNEENREIKRADNYLLGESTDKPEWLDDFLRTNQRKMEEAISRITSPDANDSSLAGYSHGYFNEIVQNANDLHVGETIQFNVSKSNNIYKLQCRYDDDGFKLSNIYGFLNRGMTDKGDDQTGKYGIGIKSLFCFVDSFEIRSNFCFSFSYNEEGKPIADASLSGNNPRKTELTITYRENEDNVFSTKKLSSLIDSLCGTAYIEDAVRRSFIPKQEEECLFDVRALLFLNLQSSSGKKFNLRTMVFQGTSQWVKIECDPGGASEIIEAKGVYKDSPTKWNVRKMTISVRLGNVSDYANAKISIRKEYLVFFTDNNARYAVIFPLHASNEEYLAYNRIFSTYYLKEDQKPNLFPIGAMIHSPYSNQQRTDLGDDEVRIKKAYEKIGEMLRNLYSAFCSETVTKSIYKIEISDIFHRLILQYLDAPDNYTESPLKMEGLRTEHLPKMMNGDNRPFVVRHEAIEQYMKASWAEEHEIPGIKDDLTSLYYKEIESEKVYDLEKDILNNEQQVIEGVRSVYKFLSEHWNSGQYNLLQELTGFFPCVKDFLAFSVSGQRWDEENSEHYLDDSDIDNWLSDHSDSLEKEMRIKQETLFLKLIGRYKLSKAIWYDGRIDESNLSFYSYLFNGRALTEGGPLSQRQEDQFKKRYGGLKEELLKHRIIDDRNTGKTHLVRCMVPTGPSSRKGYDFDLYIEPNFWQSEQVDGDLLLLLLEQMSNDNFPYHRIGRRSGGILFFEKEARPLQCRDNFYTHYEVLEQQIIYVNMRSIVLNRFSDYLAALRYQHRISSRRPAIAEEINVTCRQESLRVSEISQHILPKFVEKERGNNNDYILLKGCQEDNVAIGDLEADLKNECEDEIHDFIQSVSGYDVYLHAFDSGSRKKTIAFWCDKGFYLKQSASDQYKKIAKKLQGVAGPRDRIFVFYHKCSIMDAFSSVFAFLEIEPDIIRWMNRYLPGGNITKTVGLDMWMCGRQRKARPKYPLWRPFSEAFIGPSPSFETVYRLLTARGSYDNHCPICGRWFCGMEVAGKRGRPIQNALLKNACTEGEENNIKYVPTVMCDSCFNWLNESLYRAKLTDNKIIFETRTAHGQHEKRITHTEVTLSPINLALIRIFKLGNCT